MSDPTTTTVAQTPRAEGVALASVVGGCTDCDPFYWFSYCIYSFVCLCVFVCLIVCLVVFYEVILQRLAAQVPID